MGKATIQSVLLMRVLAHAELHNTREAPDRVRAAFPGVRLAALGAAGCDDTALLNADPRIDDLLLLPANVARSPRAFRGFMAGQPCDATVMCFGATPGINYPKQILASLLGPGRKFFLNAAGALFPALSLPGLRVILRALLSVFLALVLRVALSVAARLTRPGSVEGAGLPAPGAVRRLLFLRLDHIGDVAMSLPALHALRQQYPAAQVDALVLPSVAPLLAGHPDVDTIIPYAAPVFTRGGSRAGVRETFALIRRLRRERYDVAVDLRGNDLCRLLAFLAGARRRVGPAHSQYEMPGRPNLSCLLTHPVAQTGSPCHAVTRSLEILHASGLPASNTSTYRLPVRPESRLSMRETLAGLGVSRAYALIHARPSEASREWRPERFAAVADDLAHSYGLEVLLTGAPADREYNESIRAQAAHPERVHNAAGLFSLPELPALCAGADLMVSVDTGPMHIAALVGTPLVTLFHPTLARLHHPYGQPDGVLTPPLTMASTERVWDEGILAAIPVEAVLKAVDRKIGARTAIASGERRSKAA